VISYCIASFRPTYSRLLVDELLRKTSTAYEILVWLNLDDPAYEAWLADRTHSGFPVRIVGKTPENIGMRAYLELFGSAAGEMVAQIDDDVVMVSPGIAEHAAAVFRRFPWVRQLTADVWQDAFTTGARPPMRAYRPVDRAWGLWDGPIDGWFSVYHRSVLPLFPTAGDLRYFPLGGMMQRAMRRQGLRGLLCTAFRVFHVIGPQYASHYGMLAFEIEKYRTLGRRDIVDWYEREAAALPAPDVLEANVRRIAAALAAPPLPGGESGEGERLLAHSPPRRDGCGTVS
jgi:hypothetical protein